jgi:hypothetical protein
MRNKDVAIAQPWGWELPSTSPFSRIPSRPRHRQPQGFDTNFDFRTIIYDAFYLPERNELLIIGPPFLNLHDMANGIIATSGVETFPVLAQELDRHMRITVQLHGRPDHVVLQSQMGDVRVPVIEADQQTFAGKRVLLTLSKNNRLEWICCSTTITRLCIPQTSWHQRLQAYLESMPLKSFIGLINMAPKVMAIAIGTQTFAKAERWKMRDGDIFSVRAQC